MKKYPGEWVALASDELTVLAHHEKLKVLNHIVKYEKLGKVTFLKVPIKVECSVPSVWYTDEATLGWD